MLFGCAPFWEFLRGSVYDSTSSCRSPERDTKDSLSLFHHHQLSQETGLQPWVTHWATVISIKYPLCWCQRSQVLQPKRSSAEGFWLWCPPVRSREKAHVSGCLMDLNIMINVFLVDGQRESLVLLVMNSTCQTRGCYFSCTHTVPPVGRNSTLQPHLRSLPHHIIWFSVITAWTCLPRVTKGQMIVYSWPSVSNEPYSVGLEPGQDSFCLRKRRAGNPPFFAGNATSTDGRSYFRVAQPTA